MSKMIVTKRQLHGMIQEALVKALDEAKFDPKIITQRKFPTLDQAVDFVDNKVGLRFLGQGSSRIVFAIDSRKALKMALNAKGIAQNQAELDTATDSHNGLVAKILQYDPEFKWVVSELVRPIDNEAEFKQLTGVPWTVFAYLLTFSPTEWKSHVSNTIRYIGSFEKVDVTPEEVLKSPFLNMAMTSLASLKKPLLEADLMKLDHWGKTPDQRVVLLDYGYTAEVWQNHYDPNIGSAPTNPA